MTSKRISTYAAMHYLRNIGLYVGEKYQILRSEIDSEGDRSVKAYEPDKLPPELMPTDALALKCLDVVIIARAAELRQAQYEKEQSEYRREVAQARALEVQRQKVVERAERKPFLPPRPARADFPNAPRASAPTVAEKMDDLMVFERDFIMWVHERRPSTPQEAYNACPSGLWLADWHRVYSTFEGSTATAEPFGKIAADIAALAPQYQDGPVPSAVTESITILARRAQSGSAAARAEAAAALLSTMFTLMRRENTVQRKSLDQTAANIIRRHAPHAP